MKLYYSSGACSLAVRITLHELHLPCTYEAVDLKTKVTETGKNYLTINLKGSVPALAITDSEILTENLVILHYLADHHPSTLLPAEGMPRYRALEWLNFMSSDVHKSCGPLFNPNVPEELKEKIFRPILKNKLIIADNALSKHPFLMGNEMTLADIYLFVVCRWLKKLGIAIETLPHLARFFNDMKQRPTVQHALQEEGLHS